MFRSAPPRIPLYFLVNVAFALLLGMGAVASGYSNPRLFYLILLFALCSAAIIDLDGLNGSYSLLALFMFVYFVSFGALDVINILVGNESVVSRDSEGLLSKAEAVILVSGVMWVIGFRTSVFIVRANRPTRVPKDWSKGSLLTVGLLFWAIGTIAKYRWNVYIQKDITNEAVRRALASIDPLTTSAYILAQMCQPLGMLLLMYAFKVFRKPYLLIITIIVILPQVFIGFVIDIKGEAMLGMILVIITSLLVDGRLPKTWLVLGALFVTFVYPYFTAYRSEIHGAGIARTTVVENFGKILQKTIAAKDKISSGPDHQGTFLERANVKSSVETIVAKTGNGVDFQHGHTLSPILATFVPRIVWSDKQGVPTGQLFNHQFHLFDSDDIWVSPSHLGELYWNFGWPGAVFGMTLIGLICGWVGAGFALTEYRTVTRVLVVVITAKLLIVSFEGAIGDIYVGWLRIMAGIAVMHLTFARVPALSRSFRSIDGGQRAAIVDPIRSERPFLNLLT